MNQLFDAANRYLKNATWQDLSLIKFCLCAIGVLIGLIIPHRRKRTVAWIASLVFVATYVPLMEKFLPYLLGEKVSIEDIYQ